MGEEEFVELSTARMQKSRSRREQPSVKQLEAISPGRILRAVAHYFGLAGTELTGKRTGHRDERAIALELMYRHSGASQARIGELVGLDYTAVSRERKRLRERSESDKRLKRRLAQVETSVLS